MTLVFMGLVKDIPTAVITCSTQPLALCLWPNHSHGDILYQAHEHECRIVFIQQLKY